MWMKRGQKGANTRRGLVRKPLVPTVAFDLHDDVHVNVIVVTEDRLRLSLEAFLRSARKCQSWRTPAGMLLTEIVGFATSPFHNALGLSGDQWNMVFDALVPITVLWLIGTLIRGHRAPSISSLIESLKNAPQSKGAPTI